MQAVEGAILTIAMVALRRIPSNWLCRLRPLREQFFCCAIFKTKATSTRMCCERPLLPHGGYISTQATEPCSQLYAINLVAKGQTFETVEVSRNSHGALAFVAQKRVWVEDAISSFGNRARPAQRACAPGVVPARWPPRCGFVFARFVVANALNLAPHEPERRCLAMYKSS